MTTFDAVLLGIVQGITEFLPVSSSAHLRIFSQFLDIAFPSEAFEVFLNLGTVTATLIYFWNDVSELFWGGIDFLRQKNTSNRKHFVIILVGTAAAALLILSARKIFSTELIPVAIMPVLMIVFAVILWFCDSKPCRQADFSMRDGIIVGIAQAAALVPGISRLGACLSAARYLRYSRAESFKFSMLLSAPLFIGASTLIFAQIINGTVAVDDWNAALLGFSAALISGLMSVHLVYKFLKSHTLLSFVIYRIIFAVFILLHSRALF